MANIILKHSLDPRKRPDPATLELGELAVNCGNTVNVPGPATGVYFKTEDNQLLKVGPISVGSSPPNTAPTGFAGNCLGELWYDTGATTADAPNGMKIWAGTQWQPAGGLSGSTTAACTFLGVDAGKSFNVNQSGTESPLFIGYKAGESIDYRTANIGIGNYALQNIKGQVPANNVAIGEKALSSLTLTGSQNVFIGYKAGELCVGMNDSVAVGAQALRKGGAAASQSIAIGVSALENATAGPNIAIGPYCGTTITTGAGNILMGTGQSSTLGLTTGSYNLMIGYKTYAVGAASDNVVIATGVQLDTNSSGNTIVGSKPGVAEEVQVLKNCNNNTVIGADAASILAEGSSGNTIVGKIENYLPTLLTNTVVIASGGTPVFAANGNGAWGIPGGSGGNPLQFNYGTAGQFLRSNGSGGTPTWATVNAALLTDSDVTTTFESADGKTITIENGIITGIS